MVDGKRMPVTGASWSWNILHALIHNLEQRWVHLRPFLYFSKMPKWIASEPDSHIDRIYPNWLEPRSLGLRIHQASTPSRCLLISRVPGGFPVMHISCLDQEHGSTSDPPILPNDQFGLFRVFLKLMRFLFLISCRSFLGPFRWVFFPSSHRAFAPNFRLS